MRDLVRKIVQGYESLHLEGQEDGAIQFSGQEPGTHQAVWIQVLPRLLGKDPHIAARFNTLAKAIRQLNHPNIVAVQKVGEESGLPYLVTRALAKGQRLAAKLDQPWAVDAAADVVMQTGQALEHAYNKGLIHGSLSPDTINVQDNGKVVVTDFGVAQLRNLLGLQLQAAASPFRAPEQASGGAADARTDVYALGAVLYTLLAQRPPQVVRGEVLAPSRFNPDVPPAMDAVVVKALALDPGERYPDVKAFLVAFGAITLVPMLTKAQTTPDIVHCPQCGAENQGGRFCRKCGARLEPTRSIPMAAPGHAKAPTAIQVTKVEVGRVEIGKGVERQETAFAQETTVVSSELASQFPEPLEMPKLDDASLWPSLAGQSPIAMPEPPPMPAITWPTIATAMPEVPSIPKDKD